MNNIDSSSPEQVVAYDCKCSSYCGTNDLDGDMVSHSDADYVKREHYVELRKAAESALRWLESNSQPWSAVEEISALRVAISKGILL